jgi:hypothetical protein
MRDLSGEKAEAKWTTKVVDIEEEETRVKPRSQPKIIGEKSAILRIKSTRNERARGLSK